MTKSEMTKTKTPAPVPSPVYALSQFLDLPHLVSAVYGHAIRSGENRAERGRLKRLAEKSVVSVDGQVVSLVLFKVSPTRVQGRICDLVRYDRAIQTLGALRVLPADDVEYAQARWPALQGKLARQ